MNLIDEYWFLVHPLISGNGKRLFETRKLDLPINLSLNATKVLKSGAAYTTGVPILKSEINSDVNQQLAESDVFDNLG
jgi:hypothetical protein